MSGVAASGRCPHGYVDLGERPGCWACAVEEEIQELKGEISELKNELLDVETQRDQLHVERDEFEGRTNAIDQELRKALNLIENYAALVAQLPLNDRQSVDQDYLRRHAAQLGLKIDRHL